MAKTLLRRRLIDGALASGIVLTVGAGLDAALPSIAAAVQGRLRVRLGYIGNPCEAVTLWHLTARSSTGTRSKRSSYHFRAKTR